MALWRQLNACKASKRAYVGKTKLLSCYQLQLAQLVHIPPYTDADQHNLNSLDLSLIVTKSRFISFCDELQARRPEHEHACTATGSFILALCTNLAHAQNLMIPIWSQYSKHCEPDMDDIECMLRYLNLYETWRAGSFFIHRHILSKPDRLTLSVKSWKYICEIALKATNHNSCITLIEDAIAPYKHVSNAVAWKEIVKVLLIKREFRRIVHYAPYITPHIISKHDRGLLEMLVHSYQIYAKQPHMHRAVNTEEVEYISNCIDTLYATEAEKRQHLQSCLSSISRKSATESAADGRWYVVNSSPESHENGHTSDGEHSASDLSAISMDFGDDSEQMECEKIAFHLNCLETERMHHRQQASNAKADSYVSIFEWMFYSCSPHHFLSLLQAYQHVLRQHRSKSEKYTLIWQYCLLSLLKCSYKFGQHIQEFFHFVNSNLSAVNTHDQYSHFVLSLANTYHSTIQADNMRQIKYDIIQFLKHQDIMFWSFEHLQNWLWHLLTVGNTAETAAQNKECANYLFNLMLVGMLYNDNFQIRPALRALLRFGAYYQLPLDETLVFQDDKVREYLAEGIHDRLHPLHTFQFYIDQLTGKNTEEKKSLSRKRETQLLPPPEQMVANTQKMSTEHSANVEEDEDDNDDIQKQRDFLSDLHIKPWNAALVFGSV